MDEEKRPTEPLEAQTAKPEAPAQGLPVDQPVDPAHCESQTEHQPQEPQATPAKAAEPWNRLDKLRLIFDGAVAVATVLGVIFLILQWRQTDAALTVAKEANDLTRSAQVKAEADSKARDAHDQRLVAAAEMSASAASESAKHAQAAIEASSRNAMVQIAASRQAMQTDQRAWVLVSERRLPEFGREPVPLVARLTIQNVGRSPAMRVSQEAHFIANRRGAPFPVTGFRTCNSTGCTPFQTENIGASVEREFTITKNLTATELGAIVRGEYGLWVFGVIRYEDIFGNARFTEYCYEATRLMQPLSDGPTFVFIPCSFKNTAL
jgi:hypothetical protein